MVKPGALLILLAVAANFHLPQSEAEVIEFSSCPINYFGKMYTAIDVQINTDQATATACFINVYGAITSDCISVGFVGSASTVVKTESTEAVNLQTDLIALLEDSPCHIDLEFVSANTAKVILSLYSLGLQAAVGFRSDGELQNVPESILVTAEFEAKTLAVINLANDPTIQSGQYMDVSGCRINDVAYGHGETIDNDICTSVYCNPAIDSSSSSPNCVVGQNCVDGSCFTVKAVCTVTGSSVINFSNTKNHVVGQCAYTLVKPVTGSDYELLAVFKERRRKDVAFLDHLILKLSGGTKMYLKQGGIVQVGDDTLTLSEDFEEQHNVELRKVQNEVTLKIPSTSIEVVFNGYTAHVTGPTDSDLQGMCGNPKDDAYVTTWADHKSSESDTNCEAPLTDDSADPECQPIASHCELMMQAPFDTYGGLIDQSSYVDACKDILCHYPDVDGHKCQFFEAYAKSCKLSQGYTVDWSSVEGCSADPHPCHDQYCTDDEFCGDKADGTRCFCRPTFAAKYPKGFGEPTVCTSNSATLTMANCLLEDSGIEYNTLHLKDSSCTGTFNALTHMVTFFFDDGSNTCGTEVEKDGSDVKYSNTITTQDFSNEVIVRHDQVIIDFSCHYKSPEINEVTLKIADSSVSETITSGEWTFDLQMSAYTDREHQNLISPDTDLQLNQKIYVTLVTTGLDGNKVVLVTQTCYAKSEQAAADDPPYNLIVERCGDDSTVMVEGNGEGTSNSFSFNMFQFTGKTGKINLHCEVELCVPEDEDCVPACGGGTRKRRSFRSKYDRNLALITMSWDN